MEILYFLVFASILGCIPGAIAQSKGRDFLPWFIYGFLIFIVALIHSLVLQPKGAAVTAAPARLEVDPADELAKYADLKDRGAITPEEFDAQKQRIMSKLTPSIVTGR